MGTAPPLTFPTNFKSLFCRALPDAEHCRGLANFSSAAAAELAWKQPGATLAPPLPGCPPLLGGGAACLHLTSAEEAGPGPGLATWLGRPWGGRACLLAHFRPTPFGRQQEKWDVTVHRVPVSSDSAP